MSYKIERRTYEVVPQLQDSDVMTLSAAADLLDVPYSSIHSYLSTGTLTTIVSEDARRMAYGKPRRFVLCSEVAALLATRQVARDGTGVPAT